MGDEVVKEVKMVRHDVTVVSRTFMHNELMESGKKTYIMLPEGTELPACLAKRKQPVAEEAKK